jgi:hypothetical protein
MLGRKDDATEEIGTARTLVRSSLAAYDALPVELGRDQVEQLTDAAFAVLEDRFTA